MNCEVIWQMLLELQNRAIIRDNPDNSEVWLSHYWFYRELSDRELVDELCDAFTDFECASPWHTFVYHSRLTGLFRRLGLIPKTLFPICD